MTHSTKKYRPKKSSQRTRQLLISSTHFSTGDRHGGLLRKKRKGRTSRPLSKKEPLHLVFKAHRHLIRECSFRGTRSFRLIQILVRRYAVRFQIRVDQISVQGDHLHLLVRCSHRFFFQAFFRVLAGQIAQRFQKEGLLRFVTDTSATTTKSKLKLWMYRPFSRIVRGFRAYRIVRDYIQLNEQEARGVIRYNARRLAGLSAGEWSLLWS